MGKLIACASGLVQYIHGDRICTKVPTSVNTEHWAHDQKIVGSNLSGGEGCIGVV